jgi:hypothetical protein
MPAAATAEEKGPLLVVAAPVAAEKKPAEPVIQPYRGLLIFLSDAPGSRIDPITLDFIIALAQKAGPIVASQKLVYNAFNSDVYEGWRQYLKFNQAQWIIKEIDPLFYLLIPISHLTTFAIKPELVEKYDVDTISREELVLGLKVNHMRLIVDISKLPLPDDQPERALYFPVALKNIFCQRRDYPKKTTQPTWAVYMDGHGEVRLHIVSLSLEMFKEVLNFFEYKINTRLLAISSCYAAGITTEILFKEKQSQLQKTYPFAIITQALTDATTMTDPLIISRNLETPEHFLLQYAQFLDAVTKDVIVYKTAAKHIFTARESFASVASTTPLIKMPGLEWFSVLDGESVVSLGRIDI